MPDVDVRRTLLRSSILIQEQADGVLKHLEPPIGTPLGECNKKALASHDAVVLSLSPPPTPATAVRLTRFQRRFRKSEEGTASSALPRGVGTATAGKAMAVPLFTLTLPSQVHNTVRLSFSLSRSSEYIAGEAARSRRLFLLRTRMRIRQVDGEIGAGLHVRMERYVRLCK